MVRHVAVEFAEWMGGMANMLQWTFPSFFFIVKWGGIDILSDLQVFVKYPYNDVTMCTSRCDSCLNYLARLTSAHLFYHPTAGAFCQAQPKNNTEQYRESSAHTQQTESCQTKPMLTLILTNLTREILGLGYANSLSPSLIQLQAMLPLASRPLPWNGLPPSWKIAAP